MSRIAVGFKHEDDIDGEPIGPLYIYDEDDPEGSWVGHLVDVSGQRGGWRSLSEARAWAEARGYAFYEE